VVACEPDLADCNGDHEDGCEIDTARSAEHCGACREPCLEGLVCEARECVAVGDATVVVLGTDQELGRVTQPPCRIAVAGDDVFFVGETHLSRVPRTGGAAPARLFAPATGELTGVAADATEVFAAGSGGVTAVSRTTGAIRTVTSSRAVCVAVDGENVFFTDGSAVHRVDRAGGMPVELAPSRAAGVGCLAVDATDVFFSAEGPAIAPGLSLIGRVARGGGPLTEIYVRADTLTGVECLALDGGSVFFTVAGSLRRIALDGTGDTLLASLDSGPGVIPQRGLAAGDDLVWAAHPGRGAIARVAAAGGELTILTTRGVPHSVAIDADRVYWTSPDTRELFSAAR
jgi:hypothetical protein